jgi:hypothetical protein
MTDQPRSSLREYPPGLPLSFGPRSTREEFGDKASYTSERFKHILKSCIPLHILPPRGFDIETPIKIVSDGASPTGSSLSPEEERLLLSRSNLDTLIMLGSNFTNYITLSSVECLKTSLGISALLKWCDGTTHQFLFPEGIISDHEWTSRERTRLAW